MLVDALGNPVEVMLTPGQDHDLTCAESLIEFADPDALIGDKAFDADPFIDTLNQRGNRSRNPAQGQAQDNAGLRLCALL